MTNPLEAEFQYYLEHQAELAKKYAGKVIAIKGAEVVGVYDDESSAISETQETHELGTFLVQKVGQGPEGHTHVFRSRVALSHSPA